MTLRGETTLPPLRATINQNHTPAPMNSATVWDQFLSAAEWDGTVSWIEGLLFVRRLDLLEAFIASPWWDLMNERLDAGELGFWVSETVDLPRPPEICVSFSFVPGG